MIHPLPIERLPPIAHSTGSPCVSGRHVVDVASSWDTAAWGEGDETPAAHSKLIVTASPDLELMLAVATLAEPTPSPGLDGLLDPHVVQAARR